MNSRRGNSAQRWRSPGHCQVRNSRASRSYSLYFHPRLCRPRGYRQRGSSRLLCSLSRATSGHAIRYECVVYGAILLTSAEGSSPPLSPLPLHFFSPTTIVVPRDICHYATATAAARTTLTDRDRVYSWST